MEGAALDPAALDLAYFNRRRSLSTYFRAFFFLIAFRDSMVLAASCTSRETSMTASISRAALRGGDSCPRAFSGPKAQATS